MKNTALSIFALIIFGMIFTSCSRFSSVSIAKRHYRNGYYVETVASNNSSKKTEAVAKVAVMPTTKTEAQITPIPEKQAHQQILNESRSVSPDAASSSISVRQENSASHANAASLSQVKKVSPFFNSFRYPEKNDRLLSSTKAVVSERRHDDGGGHALGGFLWFLVVLLLILFLLNFILALDLGGLVYLILVIALILLLFRLIGML